MGCGVLEGGTGGEVDSAEDMVGEALFAAREASG